MSSLNNYKNLIRKYREFADDMQSSDRGHDRINADLLYEAADAIEELTRTGEWKVFYDDDSPQDGFNACSECGFIRYHEDIFPRNYCPKCGAKMEYEAD